MSIYYNIINNWQLYLFIFAMISFVLILLVSMLVCIAKQDDPTIELPKFIRIFIGD